MAVSRTNGSARNDPLGQYLDALGRHPLLTDTQEVELAQVMEAGRSAQARMCDPDVALSSKERGELQILVEQGRAARCRFIEANLRLAVSIARRYAAVPGITLSDLVQEANLGLIRGVEKFDYRRGFKFSTYATWWIRQAITRGIADKSRTIRLPVHLGDSLARVRAARARLFEQMQREATTEEIAEASGLTPQQVQRVLVVPGEPASLDQAVGDDDAVLGDFIADPAQNPFAAVDETLRQEGLWEMLGHLSERERTVVVLHFGLLGAEPQSLGEIGRGLGVSKERIRQIEALALRKLRDRSTCEA